MEFWQIIVSIGIPSFIMSLGLALIKKRIDLTEKKREIVEQKRILREKEKEQHEIMMLRCILASIELGEVTAKALKGEKSNGDLDRALDNACKLRQSHRDFLQEKGVQHLI